MRVTLCSVKLVLWAAAAFAATPAVGDETAAARPIRVIEGRVEPERLPEVTVWDNVFAFLHSTTKGKTDPKDPDVREFVQFNLYISAQDTRILFPIVAKARARIKALEGRTDDEFEAERGLPETGKTWATTRNEQIAGVTLQARDEILRSLSPRGARALLRFVAIAKQGMTAEVPE